MDDTAVRTMIVVVMGVTGSGKSSVGRLLAQRLGVPYAEADSFHSPANVAKMKAGQPLDDADRYPWLAAIGEWIRLRVGLGGVVSCSALKYAYRDLLRAAHPGLWFLHLDADPKTIVRRVADRTGHFMPASLVESQFAALEPLRPQERGLVADAAQEPEAIVTVAIAAMAASANRGERNVADI